MITYGIIEDQKNISYALMQTIEKLRPDYKCIFTAVSVHEAIESLKRFGHPNLLFVDVELEDGICFDLFKSVDVQSSVIFTTAFPDKVFDAFHMQQSIDYLLKPYDDFDLQAAMDKFEQIHSVRRTESSKLDQVTAIANELLTRMQPFIEPKPNRILTIKGDKYESIEVAEVGWLVSEDKYVMVITKDGNQQFTTFSSLNEAEEILPSKMFFRANRKYILNINSVISVNKSFGGKLSVRFGVGTVQEKLIVPSVKRVSFLSWYGAGMF